MSSDDKHVSQGKASGDGVSESKEGCGQDSRAPSAASAASIADENNRNDKTDEVKNTEKDRNQNPAKGRGEKDRKEAYKKDGRAEKGGRAAHDRDSRGTGGGGKNDRRDRRADINKTDESARSKNRESTAGKGLTKSKSEDLKDERGDGNKNTDVRGRGDERVKRDTRPSSSKKSDSAASSGVSRGQVRGHNDDYKDDRDYKSLKDSDRTEKKGDKSRGRKEQHKKENEAELTENSGAALLNLLNKPSGKSGGSRSRHKEKDSGDMKGKSATDLEAQWQKEEEERKKKEEEERRKEEEKKHLEEEIKKKEEEERRLKEEEQKSLDKYIEESTEILHWKNELMTRNIAAAEERPDERFFGKLDSNLKRNTAFVKKLKNLTENQKESLIKDFQGLNLSKYVGEAAAAITEAKLKMSDVNCAVHICVLFHQRYGDFSSLLLENWQKVLMSKKDEKISNPSKLRVDLRFFAELVAVGVFTAKEGLPVLANQLRMIINNDKEEHNNLSIILSFCKHCGDDYAGLLSRKYRVLSEKYEKQIPRSQFLPAERQKACRTLFKDYYTSVCKHIVGEHKELKGMERQNRKILQTKGELSTERKEKFEAMKQAYNKLFSNMQMFADLLDDEVPDLPEEEFKSDAEGGGLDMFNPVKDGEYQYEGDSTLFEDEETRMFYENLPDLKAFIPKILYKDSEDVSEQTGGETGLEEDLESLNVEDVEKEMEAAAMENKTDKKEEVSREGKDEDLPPDELEVLHDNDDEDADINATVRLILDAFIQQLPNCVNRELIDKAATDFCMNLNTKANRKKLVRALFTVHRTRYDLLPFYARLVAILHPCMPDVANDLCTLLKGDFKWHVRKKDQINIESKLKTVRFIGELVKFKMFSKSEALHCIKMLMFDFSHHNIEMVCALLETSGRFLYRSADSHHRTKVYLDVMMRKKAALHLDGRYTTMIENAYYYCNPPEIKQEAKKVRPPMHQYIRKLLYKELSKIMTEKVLRQMRKLNWDDEEIAAYATKCLVEIHNVRYNSIHCCANLLAGLAPYHEHIAIQVVDGLLEDIRIGMEINHPKYNQRRVSSVKYLGELYNYRMVESSVVFKTLYTFILYGVTMDEEVISALDPPEHLFRIRLVCVLLDTCGQYFDRGSSKKKLDFFMVYFQKYVWFKKKNKIWDDTRPFPVDVDYMVRDTIEALRPKLKICENYEEACQSVEQQDNELKAKIASVLTIHETEEEEGNLTTIHETDESGPDDLSQNLSQLNMNDQDSTQESDADEGRRRPSSYSQDQSAEHVAHSLESDDNVMESAGEDEEDDQVTILNGKSKQIKSKEDDDFLSAFDKMLVDNLQARNAESVKVPTLDIAVPMHLRGQKKDKMGIPPVVDEVNNTVQFVLMTRRGNKQQYTNLNVPMSAEFATKFKEREEAEQAEKERMKRVTLDIHERQEEEDFQEMLASFSRPSPVNSNRERRVRYQHPKGAPDADLIFGSK